MKPKHSEPQEGQRQLNIIRPPDFIFKYRWPSRTAPSQEVIGKQGTFDFVGVKYPTIYAESDEFFVKHGMQREWFKYPVTFGDGKVFVSQDYPPLTDEEAKMGGQLACFKDCPYPAKGHPFPEALYAVNTAKRFTREFIEAVGSKELRSFGIHWILMRKRKRIAALQRILRVYVQICEKAMQPYVLDRRFMSKYGREIMDFVSRFLQKIGVNEGLSLITAEYFASQIDWDNAYWMRVGDAGSTTSKEALLADPRGELIKLGMVFIERNPNDPETAAHIMKGIKLFSYLLIIPKYKRIFRECVQASEFENFQFDKADEYHSWVYSDYNYGGETLEQRIKKYKDYHIEHPPEPPRLEINRPMG